MPRTRCSGQRRDAVTSNSRFGDYVPMSSFGAPYLKWGLESTAAVMIGSTQRATRLSNACFSRPEKLLARLTPWRSVEAAPPRVVFLQAESETVYTAGTRCDSSWLLGG